MPKKWIKKIFDFVLEFGWLKIIYFNKKDLYVFFQNKKNILK